MTSGETPSHAPSIHDELATILRDRGVDSIGIAKFVTFFKNTGEWRRELRAAECGSLDKDRAFLEEFSPVNTIDRIEAPLFVLHGANDPRVPVSEAHRVVEEACEQGVAVRSRSQHSLKSVAKRSLSRSASIVPNKL